jgi:hypothetical protein
MTQEINLTQLRELATAEALNNEEFNLLCDAVPVLIDTAEAAIAMYAQPTTEHRLRFRDTIAVYQRPLPTDRTYAND